MYQPVLTCVVALFYLSFAVCNVYKIITPLTNSTCNATKEHCLFLEQFCSIAVQNNATLNFQPGNHSLASQLNITDVENFTMLSESNSTWIVCDKSAKFVFTNINKLYIENLTFSGCGSDNLVQNESVFVIHQSNSTVINNIIFRYFEGYHSVLVQEAHVEMNNGIFFKHDATSDLVKVTDSTIIFCKCNISSNIVANSRAVVRSINTSISVTDTKLMSNSANYGLLCFNCTVNVSGSWFENSNNTKTVVHIAMSNFEINNTRLVDNTAGRSVMFIIESRVKTQGVLEISGNAAQYDSLKVVNSKVTFKAEVIHSNNDRAMTIKASYVKFYGSSKFLNGTAGAIRCFRSIIYFLNNTTFSENHAKKGGAIRASYSKLFMYGGTVIIKNEAVHSHGGGIYLFQSQLNCQQHCIYSENKARGKGGAIHAVSSLITVGSEWNVFNMWKGTSNSSLVIENNEAMYGGGLSFEANSKIYGLGKSENWYNIVFRSNFAEVDGLAIFVNDNTTNFETCNTTYYHTHSRKTECFLQMYGIHYHNRGSIEFQNHSTGAVIFGGLLDRCTVNPSADVHRMVYGQHNPVDGFTYLNEVTEHQLINGSIASSAVRICFCRGENHDCSYHPNQINTTKGAEFNVSLVAVDQVNNTVNSTIHVDLLADNSQLGKGQWSKDVKGSCKNLTFNVQSEEESEQLFFWPEGPCNNLGISKSNVAIKFKKCSCPIGFQPSGNRSCECVCNKTIASFTTTCYIESKSLSRQNNLWINYVNESSSFLIYPCPYDYCYSPTTTVSVNLNIPNGSDSQCAFHRTGLLCGKCGTPYSLSLGSSHCVLCPHRWLFSVILLGNFMSIIALVASMLMLNLTVAVGLFNGLIFYANIFVANESTFLPFSAPNFFTVFIAWLNLDLGFETCFYKGMTAYHRAWLKLVSPTCMILVLAVMICITKCSSQFARLIGRGNPVATLATIILLCYAKLLRTIIDVLSSASLTYPDGSHELVWLPDASVKYLQGKHIPLFLTAIITVTIGATYTTLLFCWQWLLQAPKIKVFKWVENTRLNLFMEANLAPYKASYRFWTGLLFFVRIIVYLVVALDKSHEKGVSLVAIGVTVTCLFLLKLALGNSIYRRQAIDNVNSLSYFNLLVYCLARLYWRKNEKFQKTIAKFSASLAFTVFVCVLFYHILRIVADIRCFEGIKEFIKQRTQKCGVMLKLVDDLNSQKQEMQATGGAQCTTTVVGLSSRQSMGSSMYVQEKDGTKNDGDLSTVKQVQTSALVKERRLQKNKQCSAVRHPYSKFKAKKWTELRESLLQDSNC